MRTVFFTSAFEALLRLRVCGRFCLPQPYTSGELSTGMRVISKTLQKDIGEQVTDVVTGVEQTKTDLARKSVTASTPTRRSLMLLLLP
ncbi:hypothetical protein [Stenotrophomonas phage CM2]